MSAVDEYRDHESGQWKTSLADAAIAEMEAENEHLKALLAATQKALIIEPGKTYVIDVPAYVTTEEYENLRDTWREMTHSNAVIFTEGMRVARERVESG